MKNFTCHREEKGVALIVVLVMIIIFASLILAVVLSATIAIRKANYYKDKTIALQIAEAGIEDCLFWMNYRGYENFHQYPCSEWNGSTWVYNASYKYFQGSDYAGTDTWTDTPPSPSNPYYQPVKGLTKPNFCKLEFEDRSDTDMDEIISTGYYNGKTATVRVRIRGSNGNGNNLHNTGGRYLRDGHWDGITYREGVATWGVPEAINKHVIYSRTINFPSVNPPTISGNVFCETPLVNGNPGDPWGAIDPSSECTFTTYVDGFAYFYDFVKPETSFLVSLPAQPASYTYYLYKGTAYYDATHTNTAFYYTESDGIYYDTDIGGGLDCFIFADTSLTVSYRVEADVLKICSEVQSTGNPDCPYLPDPVNGNGKYVKIEKQVECDGDIYFLGDNTTSESDIWTTNETFLIANNFYFGDSSNTDKVNILGHLILKDKNGLTLNNSSVSADIEIKNGGLIVKDTSSFKFEDFTESVEIDSGILMVNNSGDATLEFKYSNIKINAPIPETETIFMVYSDNGDATFNIYGDSNIDLSNVRGENKILFCVYGNKGILRIGSLSVAGDVINIPSPCIIYCYGKNAFSNPAQTLISFQASGATPPGPVVEGCVICNGTVNPAHSTTLRWNKELFLNSVFYSKLKGGRRVYLPVPGSWRIEW